MGYRYKNLSYCLSDDITDKEDDNSNQENIISISSKKFKIVDWGVINVVDDVSQGTASFEKRTPIKCGFGKCSKKATYCHKDKTNDNYFGLCTIHYKKVSDSHKNEFILLEKNQNVLKVVCKKILHFI